MSHKYHKYANKKPTLKAIKACLNKVEVQSMSENKRNSCISTLAIVLLFLKKVEAVYNGGMNNSISELLTFHGLVETEQIPPGMSLRFG